MADRLRALGVGNGMPILFEDATGGEDYPITLTKAEIIEWYWRVKLWTLSTDYKATANGTSIELNSSLTYVPGVTRERDLITSPQDKIFSIPVTATGPGSTTDNASFVVFNVAPFMYRQPNATDYLPYLVIFGTISASESGDAAQLIFSSRAADVPIPTGTLTANVYGKPVTLTYREDIVGAGTSFVHTTFDLTPLEWWAYAAEDASAIYDTATGAQLQSPLN